MEALKRARQSVQTSQRLETMNYEIDEEHQHIMREISQPGKPVDLDSMNEKVSICSFGLVWFLCIFMSIFALFLI